MRGFDYSKPFFVSITLCRMISVVKEEVKGEEAW